MPIIGIRTVPDKKVNDMLCKFNVLQLNLQHGMLDAPQIKADTSQRGMVAVGVVCTLIASHLPPPPPPPTRIYNQPLFRAPHKLCVLSVPHQSRQLHRLNVTQIIPFLQAFLSGLISSFAI